MKNVGDVAQRKSGRLPDQLQATKSSRLLNDRSRVRIPSSLPSRRWQQHPPIGEENYTSAASNATTFVGHGPLNHNFFPTSSSPAISSNVANWTLKACADQSRRRHRPRAGELHPHNAVDPSRSSSPPFRQISATGRIGNSLLRRAVPTQLPSIHLVAVYKSFGVVLL